MAPTTEMAQIQATIDYVLEALSLPDYVSLPDVAQQTALHHLVHVTGGNTYASDEAFHRTVLTEIREWLAPILQAQELKISMGDCCNLLGHGRRNTFEEIVIRDALDRAIKTLSPREKYVIENYYGIYGQPKSTKEIATELGLTRAGVQGIRENAIHHINQALNT